MASNYSICKPKIKDLFYCKNLYDLVELGMPNQLLSKIVSEKRNIGKLLRLLDSGLILVYFIM